MKWFSRNLFESLSCILLLLAVLCLMGWKYRQLETQTQIRLFFRNTARIFSFVQPPEFGTSKAPLSFNPTGKTGNLLTQMPEIAAAMPRKYLYDPLQNLPAIDLRYGIVQHVFPPSILPEPSEKPVWFCYSTLPGFPPPRWEIETASEENGIPVYRFLSCPYDGSNGLQSAGYFYADSAGIERGKRPKSYQ